MFVIFIENYVWKIKYHLMNLLYHVYTMQGNLKNNNNNKMLVYFINFDFSIYGEFNLKSTTVTERSCSLIAETFKYEPTISILNLSDCILPPNGLKTFLNLVNYLTNLKILNLKGNQIGSDLTIYISNILSNNTNITEYVTC